MNPTVPHRLTPMVHVIDVEQSIAFYEKLGFRVKGRFAHGGSTAWAAIETVGGAEVMFARASGPIDADQQAVLLYLYVRDAHTLRTELLAKGIADGGSFNCEGTAHAPVPRSVAFQITFPEYMPEGELRVHDPDGYCLLIGQSN